MSEGFETEHPVVPPMRERPRLLVLLAFLLFLECAFLAIAAAFLAYELATLVPTSYASAVMILALTIIAAVWLYIVAVSTLKAKPWVRGAALTWQVLQLAVAIASFQGLFARDDIGWFLLIPAVIVLVLLFTKPVMAATARRD